MNSGMAELGDGLVTPFSMSEVMPGSPGSGRALVGGTGTGGWLGGEGGGGVVAGRARATRGGAGGGAHPREAHPRRNHSSPC